jgi:hypothetical protein
LASCLGLDGCTSGSRSPSDFYLSLCHVLAQASTRSCCGCWEAVAVGASNLSCPGHWPGRFKDSCLEACPNHRFTPVCCASPELLHSTALNCRFPSLLGLSPPTAYQRNLNQLFLCPRSPPLPFLPLAPAPCPSSLSLFSPFACLSLPVSACLCLLPPLVLFVFFFLGAVSLYTQCGTLPWPPFGTCPDSATWS